MKYLLVFVLTLSLNATALFAQETEVSETTPKPGMDCEQALTVFQDVSGLGRKDRAAKHMTERHAEMAKDGWRFLDLHIYTENGDLEGFFLSYKRAIACPLREANG